MKVESGRQGDVLLIKTKREVEESDKSLLQTTDALVLAVGSNKKAHTVKGKALRYYTLQNKEKKYAPGFPDIFLIESDTDFVLEHIGGSDKVAPHDPIHFKAGSYAYNPQHVYDKEAMRRAVD